MEEVVVDWENLDALPLSLIFDKLVERIDHIYFSVVCKNWYSIAKFNYQSRRIKNNVLPMLMIPKRKSRKHRCLYEISTNKTYHFQLPVNHNNRLCGSSHGGWVAKMNEKSKGTIITLLNPFKKLPSISLPPIYMKYFRRLKYPECNVHKVILSCNPTIRPRDYVVVVIYNMRGCLAFIKAGQKSWTFVDAKYYGFLDILFYKGLVYAVGRRKNIVSFDICSSGKDSFDHEVIPNVVSSDDDNYYCDRAYLVESLEGDLFLVNKFIGYPDEDGEENNLPSSGTEGFEVYKLELDLQNGKLIQMIRLESLGDNVLFVGDSHSVSMSASYFANYLQKDSIYYTDDFYDEDPHCYPNGPFDMKIYNIKDESFREHCPFQQWFRRMPPSLWIIPPFQWD